MNKLMIAVVAAALVLGSFTVSMASDRSPGASGYSPGHEMQKYGSKRGQPGASGYAPGHEMKRDRDDVRR